MAGGECCTIFFAIFGVEMKNAIIIIGVADIPAALTVAESLDDYVTFVVEPNILDKIIAYGFKNPRFLNWPEGFRMSDLQKSARQLAFDCESMVEIVMREAFPDVPFCSWQHLSLLHVFMGIKWYSSLWHEIIEVFRDYRVNVLMCDRAAHYYEISFIPSLLLIQNLIEANIVYNAYTYAGEKRECDLVPNLPPHAGKREQYDILAHIPTCFYDIDYFNSELRASGKSIFNIDSKVKSWSIPVYAAHTSGMVTSSEVTDRLPAPLMSQINHFVTRITESLDHYLAPYISIPLYRSHQVQHIAGTYKSQLITYFLLEVFFADRVPSKLLISNHDDGLHGPIISFATKERIPVVVLPHSKIAYDYDFNGSNVTYLAHPIQGELIADKNGKRIMTANLAYPEEFRCSTMFTEPVKKIGLLLNCFSAYGILETPYVAYIEGIKKIYQWCLKNNIELGIRGRPNNTIMHALITEVGIEQSALVEPLRATMEQFAENYDLCLMYDVPTTGALEYLKRSIPLLNPVPADITWYAAHFMNSNIVPRGSVETILDVLNSFISDNTNFYLFKNNQFREYINLFSNSLPLRHFL